MTVKLVIPTKIVINKDGFSYGFKQKFIRWNDIKDIKYFSIANTGRKLIYIYFLSIPMLGIMGILQAIRLLFVLQNSKQLNGITTVE